MKKKKILDNKAIKKIVKKAFITTYRNTHSAGNDIVLKKELDVVADLIRTYPSSTMGSLDFIKRLERLNQESAITMLLLSNMYFEVSVYAHAYQGRMGDFFKEVEETLTKTAQDSNNHIINVNYQKNIQVDECKKNYISKAQYPSLNMCILISLFLNVDKLSEYFTSSKKPNKRKGKLNDKSSS